MSASLKRQILRFFGCLPPEVPASAEKLDPKIEPLLDALERFGQREPITAAALRTREAWGRLIEEVKAPKTGLASLEKKQAA
jgi:hypothetical protein